VNIGPLREHMPAVSQSQWEVLVSFLNSRRAAQPHEIAIATGIRSSTALAIFAHLASMGATTNYLLLYHGCSEAPFAARQLRDGLPSFPLQCTLCDEEIVDDRNIGYDTRTMLTEGVTLELERP
jgi:hypothetical protein